MTTVISTPQTSAPADIETLTQQLVDFDTRLALASAGMDAIIEHKYADTLGDAQAAFERAVAEARQLSVYSHPVKPAFQPHPVLAAARRLIEQRGWVKDVYSTGPGGGVCAMGAIREVVYGPRWAAMELGDPSERSAVVELLNRIASDVGHTDWSVARWNDAQQSKQDVLRLLY